MLTFRFWPTVFVLGVAALTLRLGFWQLHRAQDKEARAAQQALHAKLAPRLIGPTVETLEDVIAKPVRVRGYFMPEHTVYLDNRPYHGAPGFYVITPLRIDAPPPSDSKNIRRHPPLQATYVLINRGWLPRNLRERAALAPYETPTERVDIQGLALAHPGRLFTFNKPVQQNLHHEQTLGAPSPSGPDIRQNIHPNAYQLETGLTVQPFIIEQHSALNDHLIRDWPKPTQGVERHYGYMVQWWSLTVTVLGFGLYCALRRQPNTMAGKRDRQEKECG